MGVLFVDGKSREVPDGDAIMPFAEDLGVPFGCTEGICATCVIIVEEGMDNLMPMTNAERAMGLGKNERLACQAHLREGLVKVTW